MTFAQIESAWALQQPAKPAPVNLSALKRSFATQLKRRQRVLVLGAISTVVGLVITQVLFFANFPSLGTQDHVTFLVRLILNQGINLAIVYALYRLICRHRRLAQGRADSVRTVLTLSIASLEQEMSDYRRLKWVMPILTGLSLASICLNESVVRMGMAPLALRITLLLLFAATLSLVAWRHHRRNLQPEHARLRAALSEFELTGN